MDYLSCLHEQNVVKFPESSLKKTSTCCAAWCRYAVQIAGCVTLRHSGQSYTLPGVYAGFNYKAAAGL